MENKPRKRCELAFAHSMDRVILCHDEPRHPNDLDNWVFGFQGRMPAVPEIGLAARWINRFWKIEALIPGKDAAMVALVERATGYGFERIEVFSISPPPSPRQRAGLALINEQLSRMKGSYCGEGLQRQDNAEQGLANLAISAAV